MTRRASVGIRLDVLGKPEVVEALRDIGREGNRLADQIERVGPRAGAGLRVIDSAASEAKAQVQGLAAQAGPAGAILQTFGTAGLAAAAGIGALTLGLGAAIRAGREAVRTFAEIGDQADVLGVTAEQWQRLQFAFLTVGVEASQLQQALGQLGAKAADSLGGTGGAAEAFRRLGVSVTDAGGRLKDVQALLFDVADAMTRVEDPAERLKIANDLMGESGRKMIGVLALGADEIRRYGEEADEAGGIVSEGLVRQSQQLNAEFDKQARLLRTNLMQAFVDFAPVLLEMTEIAVNLARAIAGLTDAFRDLERQQTRTVTERYEDVVGELAELDARISGGGLSGRNLRSAEERRAALAAEMRRLEAELARRRQAAQRERFFEPLAPAAGGGGRGGGGGASRSPVEDLRPMDRSPIPLPRGMTSGEYEESLKAAEAARRLNEDMTALRVQGVQDALAGLGEFALGLRDGGDLLEQFLRDLARDLPGILMGTGSPSTGIGAIASELLGPIAGKAGSFITGLFGFAQGGSFTVGGMNSLGIRAQGGDDRLVAFRARMGEQVDVRTPGQRGAGANIAVNVYVDGDATPNTVEMFRRVAREELLRAEPVLTARALEASDRELRINPDFGR